MFAPVLRENTRPTASSYSLMLAMENGALLELTGKPLIVKMLLYLLIAFGYRFFFAYMNLLTPADR
jgi:hypothetical protein